MKRREFIKALTAATSLSLFPQCLLASTDTAPVPAKRNVLLIMVDDLCCDIGSYCSPKIHTPNIDKLATRGMRFDRAYSQYPVCNPSRASMLTSLRPETLEIYGNSPQDTFRTKKPDVVTLPQLFRQNGYYTASIGKVIHYGVDTQGKPADAQDPPSWDFCKNYGDSQKVERGESYSSKLTQPNQPDWCWWTMVDNDSHALADTKITEVALQKLEEHHDAPFFIAVGLHKPHNPYVAPRKYFDLYPVESVELPQEPTDASPLIPRATAKNDLYANFTHEDRVALQRAYSAAASYTDANIGQLLDAVDRLKLWDDTIVILISDHGYHLWEHDWWGKPSSFEECARVPCVVWAPGLDGMGKSSRGIIESLDIYPTVAELAGLKAPSSVEGKSFVPLLKDPKGAGKEAAYTLTGAGGRDVQMATRSIRTDRWRYTESGDGSVALFDHEQDPGEYYNLAPNPEYKDTCAKLSEILHRVRLKAKN